MFFTPSRKGETSENQSLYGWGKVDLQFLEMPFIDLLKNILPLFLIHGSRK